MPEDLSPTLRRWELADALRHIREDQNKTIDRVAQDLSELYRAGFSATKIGRLETGKNGANPRDVRDLCDYYAVDPDLRDRLIALAKDVRLDNRQRQLRLKADNPLHLRALMDENVIGEESDPTRSWLISSPTSSQCRMSRTSF